MRIIDLAVDGGAIDVYQGRRPLASNLVYGSVSSYVPFDTGMAEAIVTRAGSQQALMALQGGFSTGGSHTLVVRHGEANLEGVLLVDEAPAGSTAVPAVRILDEARETGPVDLYLVPAGHRLGSLKPVASGLLFGAVTRYLTVDPGPFSALIVPAGTSPAAAVPHLGSQIFYGSGSTRTLIVLDKPASSGLKVIAVLDE